MEKRIINDIKIVQLKKEHEKEVIHLLKENLYKLNDKELAKHYDYLNYENPIQDYKPVGIVAVDNNKVVGYRGFVALPLFFGDTRKKILVLIDGVTHPNYRRMGVFLKMHQRAFEIYNNQYECFLNTSSNKKSGPSYIKQKWNVLGDKDYLLKYSLLIKRFKTKKNKIFFENNVPMEIVMSISKESIFIKESKIRLDLTSKDFVEWIFKRENYRWAIITEGHTHIAYCCYCINNNYIQLIHFDMIFDDNSLSNLIQEIAHKHLLKRFHYFGKKGKSDRQKKLKGCGFWSTNNKFVRKILKKEITPFFIRPTKKDFDEKDFYINGIDSRDINNWDITKLLNY